MLQFPKNHQIAYKKTNKFANKTRSTAVYEIKKHEQGHKPLLVQKQKSQNLWRKFAIFNYHAIKNILRVPDINLKNITSDTLTVLNGLISLKFQHKAVSWPSF